MIVSLHQTARALGISHSLAARLARQGKLRLVRVPGIGAIWSPAAFVSAILRAGRELAAEGGGAQSAAREAARGDDGGSGVVQGGDAGGLGPASDKKATPRGSQVVEIKMKKGSGPKRVVRVRQPGVGPKGGKRRGMRHPVLDEVEDG